MVPTTELGEGESPLLKIASPPEGEIRPTHNGRFIPRVVFFMVKTILLEVYLLKTSSVEL